MAQPDRTPIYGPIESEFRKAARSSLTDVNKIQLYLGIHFNTTDLLGPRLLPAFAVVRSFVDEANKRSETDLNRALEEGGHVTGSTTTWVAQRDLLVRAYCIDRAFIDRALDFEAAKEQIT